MRTSGTPEATEQLELDSNMQLARLRDSLKLTIGEWGGSLRGRFVRSNVRNLGAYMDPSGMQELYSLSRQKRDAHIYPTCDRVKGRSALPLWP
jgi:hypothetical protein